MATVPHEFLGFIGYTIVVVLHIIASCVAVGTVIVTDYLHLIGLKKHSLEKKIVIIYPHLSKVINIALAVIIGTGILLVIDHRELLQSTLFQIKMTLVLIVAINGYILQKKIGPHIERLILHDLPFSDKMLLLCSVCGAVSIVSWVSILILALTKKAGYTWSHFLIAYIGLLIVAIIVAQFVERKAHGKHIKNTPTSARKKRK